MPIRSNKRCQVISIRLLMLRDYIQANANRKKAVSSEEMLAYLESKDYKIAIKSLYNDLATLEAVFGMELEYVAAQRGYILKNPPFERHELRLMIESIQASKFITQEKANIICSKIKKNLSDKHTQASLNGRAYVAERIRSMNDSVVKDTDKLHEAIENNRKIQFRYFHYSPNLNDRKSYSKSGAPYVVSPFALYWDNNNYYLYAHDGAKFRYYRIDRMETIRVRGEEREFVEEYNAENVKHQKAKVFQMYGGEEEIVKIRFRNELADQVIDQFGQGTFMTPIDSEHFFIRVPVQISPTFFAWLSTFGRKVKLLEPPRAVEKMKDFLQKSMDMYKDDGEM